MWSWSSFTCAACSFYLGKVGRSMKETEKEDRQSSGQTNHLRQKSSDVKSGQTNFQRTDNLSVQTKKLTKVRPKFTLRRT